MNRPLTLLDTAGIAVLKGSDWAVRPSGIVGGGVGSFSPASFLWDHWRLRRRNVAWISAKRWKVTGLVSARPCSGPTAWLVDHLVTAREDSQINPELLEVVGSHTARRRGHRLLLYLPDEWRLLEAVQHSGFVRCHQIVLFTLPGRSPLLGGEPVRGLRPRKSSDDLSLFRLYNASTPAEVRSSLGLTLQEWKDAQEPHRRGTRELVLEHGGSIKAWIRLDHRRELTRVRLMRDPDWDGDLAAIVSGALARAGRRTVWWEVPEFQSDLRLLLERVGFELEGSYCLAVKLLAAYVRQPSLAPAPTSG